MRKRRIRAILKVNGYKKKKEQYEKEYECFKCKGTGKWAGWISEGIYPNVDTWYEEPSECVHCNGTGIDKDITCIELERY